jgi:hypothetical protein
MTRVCLLWGGGWVTPHQPPRTCQVLVNGDRSMVRHLQGKFDSGSRPVPDVFFSDTGSEFVEGSTYTNWLYGEPRRSEECVIWSELYVRWF